MGTMYVYSMSFHDTCRLLQLSPQSRYKLFHYCKDIPWCSLQSHPPTYHSTFPNPWQQLSVIRHHNCVILRMSYKWNHTSCGLMSLRSIQAVIYISVDHSFLFYSFLFLFIVCIVVHPTPQYGCTTICLAIYLLQDMLVGTVHGYYKQSWYEQ